MFRISQHLREVAQAELTGHYPKPAPRVRQQPVKHTIEAQGTTGEASSIANTAKADLGCYLTDEEFGAAPGSDAGRLQNKPFAPTPKACRVVLMREETDNA